MQYWKSVGLIAPYVQGKVVSKNSYPEHVLLTNDEFIITKAVVTVTPVSQASLWARVVQTLSRQVISLSATTALSSIHFFQVDSSTPQTNPYLAGHARLRWDIPIILQSWNRLGLSIHPVIVDLIESDS